MRTKGRFFPAAWAKLAEDVAGSVSEHKLDHASLVLLTEAEVALGQLIAGQRISSAELDQLLAD